jgi:phosphoglycerol transferase MdoB-like AlkP superfamily enzyme
MIESGRMTRTLREVLFPRRFIALFWIAGLFILFNAAVRLTVLLWNGDTSLLNPLLATAFLIGLLFDAGVATYFLAPLALLIGLWPRASGRGLPIAVGSVLLLMTGFAAFTAVAEITFWNEFSSRFNFIAVDYLLYTKEVIGNIRESYNLPLIFSLLGLVSIILWSGIVWSVWPSLSATGSSLRPRMIAMTIWCLAPAGAYAGLDSSYKEFSHDAVLNEVAGNGYFDIWHAFWRNEIDYGRFYKTIPEEEALRGLATVFAGTRKPIDPRHPYDRAIVAAGPEKKLNVVMVMIESFSAEFMATFGNKQNLTPNMDRLAGEGLLFTRLYATGTRTVRGLEALTLSIPPTPGHSIVKRPDNAGLFTVGNVFRQKGYEPLYLYGGYSYFDNMAGFFGGNGYTLIDRLALSANEIHTENIWGVADEDLFALTIRELDKRFNSGTKFFAQVMTTSNHRPYSYPDGRIDIPSKTGREGGVKYTDWAIGKFIADAKMRPWFDDTVFVIVADHTHKGRGRTELPIDNYHIPLVIYAPKHFPPRIVDTIASQIDVSPTLLGLLQFDYQSRFFGQDILREGVEHQRALMANYQTVGYYQDGRVVELKPKSQWRVLDALTGQTMQNDALSLRLLGDAISYYQSASNAYRRGDLKLVRGHRASDLSLPVAQAK